MWGGNGKNYSWAMGYHWLVALLVFQATLASADFGYNDSQNLADCKSYLYTIKGDVHQLSLGGISTDVYLILQELGYMDDSLNEIEQDIDQISRQIGKIRDAILTPTDRQIKNQIAVTNVAETYWLSRINDNMTNSLSRIYNAMFYVGAGYTVYSPYIYSQSGLVDYSDAVSRLQQGFSELESGAIDEGTFIFRYGRWLEDMHDFFSTIDVYTLSTKELRDLRDKVLKYFMPGGSSLSNLSRIGSIYHTRAQIHESRYGTYLLQNMATNTFFSGLDVNNFFTNGVFLSQYATNAFQHVADSSGINTNEMFLGSYGSETNADVFADIITNGVELLEGNQVYSSLGDDVDADSLSNKVSMFNFTEKFDDSIKPFLDEIENASGGDWIINFGNVDLGDHFSFSIPSLTVERNETYLRYVDKFLNLLKIILGVVFFLILWRQLEQAVEST